jgi:hypothetical protein
MMWQDDGTGLSLPSSIFSALKGHASMCQSSRVGRRAVNPSTCSSKAVNVAALSALERGTSSTRQGAQLGFTEALSLQDSATSL